MPAISPFDIDTTASAEEIPVYVSGEFNADEANGGVKYNGGVPAEVKTQLSLRGIKLVNFNAA